MVTNCCAASWGQKRREKSQKKYMHEGCESRTLACMLSDRRSHQLNHESFEVFSDSSHLIGNELITFSNRY